MQVEEYLRMYGRSPTRIPLAVPEAELSGASRVEGGAGEGRGGFGGWRFPFMKVRKFFNQSLMDLDQVFYHGPDRHENFTTKVCFKYFNQGLVDLDHIFDRDHDRHDLFLTRV
jgi:hypothetical protein